MDVYTLLIVDDDPNVIHSTRLYLQTTGYRVITAQEGQEALRQAVKYGPDLILLDINIPHINGLEVCQRLKQDFRTRRIPVIMLTGKTDSEDEIHGLETGAVDYIKKPFDHRILAARIKAVLRDRMEPEIEIRDGDIYINIASREVSIGGEFVRLWPMEFDLLVFLINRKGKIFTREILLECIWGYEYFGSTRAVDITVSRLRRKLGARSHRIETVKGVGYRFTDAKK